MLGWRVSRTVCVLGFVLVTAAISTGTAGAGGNDQLLQRRPERLLIESSQRISDGRKLQKDADTSLRRAEGGVVVSTQDRGSQAADQGGEREQTEGAAEGVESGAGR